MSTNITQELIDLERQYWTAIQEKDVDTIARLTDEPCIVTGSQGVTKIDRQTMAAMLTDTSWALNKFELKEPVEVHELSDGVGLVAYSVHEELTVEGKPVTLDAADTSVWVRRDGRWLCAVHTEALSGDPFGRDRQPG